MNLENLIVTEAPKALILKINRPHKNNSINEDLLIELNRVLDLAEQNSDCRLVIIEGQRDVFCSGMDFEALCQTGYSMKTEITFSETSLYMQTIKRFTETSKIIITKLDGKVMAGGVGLVAASDLAVATERACFSLPEALWGLLPANVLPYLIRRVGYQKAYIMALTTRVISAREANSINLVDIVTDNPDEYIRRLMPRLVRIEEETIKDLKSFFRKMWIINNEMEAASIAEFARLVSQPKMKSNIINFIENGRFPWEKLNLNQ